MSTCEECGAILCKSELIGTDGNICRECLDEMV